MGNQHSRRRVRWTDLVLADDRFSHGETAAIVATAAASNDGLKQVFIKSKTVADKARVSLRTAKSARLKAKNAGYLAVQRRTWKSGPHAGQERTSRIAFTFPHENCPFCTRVDQDIYTQTSCSHRVQDPGADSALQEPVVTNRRLSRSPELAPSPPTETHAAKGEPPAQPDTTHPQSIASWVYEVDDWLDSIGIDDDTIGAFDDHLEDIGFDPVDIVGSHHAGSHSMRPIVRQAIKDTRAFIAWARDTGPPPAWLNGSHANNQGEP